MTTVAQMIKWLQTLPQDAEVECGVEERGSYENYMVMRPVKIDYCDIFDYTDKKYKDCPHVYGKIIVQISGD